MPSIPDQIRQKMKLGEIPINLGDDLLHKIEIGDKIWKIYRDIADSSEPYFRVETLRAANIDILPWNAETPDNRKPIFFQQMSLEEFQLCEMPELAGIHELLDPLAFSYNAQLMLGRCMRYLQPPLYNESFLESRGWKHVKYNERAFNERGNFRGHPHPAHAFHIFGRDNVPHTVVGSKHVCDEPARVLRSELRILLLAMWWRGKKSEWLHDEVIPVLMISIRTYEFHIIEAYYDGSKVVIRYSDPIPMKLTDSTEKQKKTRDLILRWAASTPTGTTKSFSSIPTQNQKQVRS